MPELENYLNNYFLIPKQELNQITPLFERKELKKGDYFVKAGHYCNQLSFIQSGIVRVFSNEGPKEITQWIATEGAFLTDLRSLVFDQTAKWDMQAISDCTFYTISKENYQKIGGLVKDWNELEKRFLASCFLILEERVHSFLSASAEERYNTFFNTNTAVFKQVPLQYIASMLGMSPETLSRIRAKK